MKAIHRNKKAPNSTFGALEEDTHHSLVVNANSELRLYVHLGEVRIAMVL
jgi:hypothetical protein